MIFSIEGSTSTLSMVLLKNNLIICNKSIEITNELAQIIVPAIKMFLYENSISISQISHVAVGCGPGGFTGLRSVIAVVKGMIISNENLKTIGVNGLAALGMSVIEEAKKKSIKYIISLVDTKREDVFIQLFKLEKDKKLLFPFRSMGRTKVLKLENIQEYFIQNSLIDEDVLAVGYESYLINNNSIKIKISENIIQVPNAFWIAKLAQLAIDKFEYINNTDIVYNKIEPLYVRSPEIAKKI
ncbi:MAG: tRNA (adenosine(37)-N6)-threonylcarbamoyltransferase complex dimerization subunit type 1 TsaB [Proteobacteria bacterium]|nr:tRNA (adenosine(37)-N6)-threonylcarbamoyltransferase complex dimerization subunit type 1 TsaB [Pseudomonadota bacterium]MDA1135459.1 tRNA (adenosine(37)-N6)-threonylcarbamoyltransferase complex dimerization subunit type 1 TsaB [Pseudomonadota bacterium]